MTDAVHLFVGQEQTPPPEPPVGATFADVKVGPFRGIRVLRHTAEGEARWGFLVDDRDGPLPVESGFTDHSALSLAWRLQHERDQLQTKLDAVDAACLEVCRDNHESTVGADGVDREMGRYVCIGESGDPVIDEDEPAEVIRRLNRVWGLMQERAERAEAERTPGQRRRIEALEWAIVRTLYAGDIEPPNPAAPFWFREQLLRDAGLTMERCRELMDLHRGEDRVARL